MLQYSISLVLAYMYRSARHCVYAQNPSSSENWSSIGIPSGKLNFVRGWWYLTIASSYAMAASLALVTCLVKVPRCFFFAINMDDCYELLSCLGDSIETCLVGANHNSFLYFIFGGIISTTRQSCRKGKFRSDLGRFAWMAARSYAMAASFAVPNIPMLRCLLSIVMYAWNLFHLLYTPVNPVEFLDESFFFFGL